MDDTTTLRTSPFARSAVTVAGLWLAAGAFAKLLVGNPADLPPVVRDHSPFATEVTFPLVIAIELALVALAFLKPHLAWLPLLLLFAFFEVLLAAMVAQGAESCGCFGGAISVSPWVMIAVDSLVFLLVLASRPWRALAGPAAPWTVTAAALALALGAPWFVVRDRMEGPNADFAVFDPARWQGQLVYDLPELVRWVPEEKLPTDGILVLWRQSCGHCRDHFREMVNDPARNDGSRPILLVQLQDDLESAREVDALPEGAHVTRIETPAGVQFALQTPWELHLEGGIVTRVVPPKDDEPAGAGH